MNLLCRLRLHRWQRVGFLLFGDALHECRRPGCVRQKLERNGIRLYFDGQRGSLRGYNEDMAKIGRRRT